MDKTVGKCAQPATKTIVIKSTELVLVAVKQVGWDSGATIVSYSSVLLETFENIHL